MSGLYPAFLSLAGRRCVVVGGGAVAARKVRGLVAADADVTVITPETAPDVEVLASSGLVRMERRRYRAAGPDAAGSDAVNPDAAGLAAAGPGAGDLAGAFLVVAATDDRAVNEVVVRDARAVGALVNVVDDPAACDVTVPAVVRRGDVTLAVSTGGRSPGFARFLREELADWLSDERLALLDLVADVRGELRAAGANPGPERWRQAVRSNILDILATGDRAAARRSLLAALDAPPPPASSCADHSSAAQPAPAVPQPAAPQPPAPRSPAPQSAAPQATSRRCS